MASTSIALTPLIELHYKLPKELYFLIGIGNNVLVTKSNQLLVKAVHVYFFRIVRFGQASMAAEVIAHPCTCAQGRALASQDCSSLAVAGLSACAARP